MIPFTSSPLSSGTAIALRTPSAMMDWLEANRSSLIASLVRTPWRVACTCLSNVSETSTLPCPGLRCRIDWMTSSCVAASRSKMTPLSAGMRSKAMERMRESNSLRSRSSRT